MSDKLLAYTGAPAAERQDPAQPAAKSTTRRVLSAVICLLSLVGFAAIAVFMKVYLPLQYRQQAQQTLLPRLQAAEVEDVVSFGTYEQNNDRSDGAEPIEWVVLEHEEDHLLLISRYALDCVRFNSAQALVTWKDCTLRQWLNNTFYDEAFDEAEKCLIDQSSLAPAQNPDFDSDPGERTTDKIFLLGVDDIFRYFGSTDRNHRCLSTAYALSHGAKADPDGYCVWWLRSPGYDQSVAARVQSDGSINYCGYLVYSDFNAVRPCVRISLKTDAEN